MSSYETVTGRKIPTDGVAARERRVLERLLEEFEEAPTWGAFTRSWQAKVRPILAKLAPGARTAHPLHVVGQDLALRLGIAQRKVAPPDYRDFIVDRIEERFRTRYRFCQSTGIPQAFLSQVLSGKKDFSLEKLRHVAEALDLGVALLPLDELAARRGPSLAL